MDSMRQSVAVALVVCAFLWTAADAEPLTIKGVALGDSVDRISQIGTCTINRHGVCMGKTVYGPDQDAGFIVTYVADRIDKIVITFQPVFAKEVLAGLTKRFGDPQSGGCQPGIDGCWTWKGDAVKLILIENPGGLWFSRAAPEGGY